MENFINLAQFIFIIGFVFAFFIDNFPLSFRVLGHKFNAFPISTLRSTQVMILNRFGTAFFFASAGFLVDSGFTSTKFLFLFAFTMLTSGFLTLLYIRSWKSISNSFAFYIFKKTNYPEVEVIEFSMKDIFINYPCFFNLLGLSFPIISAAFYPDYRGTLLQLGFLLNSISSMLVVFVIEPRFIKHISDDNQYLADFYHQKLLTSKALILSSMGFFCLGLTLV
jgi:hypothetical protein